MTKEVWNKKERKKEWKKERIFGGKKTEYKERKKKRKRNNVFELTQMLNKPKHKTWFERINEKRKNESRETSQFISQIRKKKKKNYKKLKSI